MEKFNFRSEGILLSMMGGEIRTQDPKLMFCRRRHFVEGLVRWAAGRKGYNQSPTHTKPYNSFACIVVEVLLLTVVLCCWRQTAPPLYLHICKIHS